jgi:hypothetical protein
MNKGFIKDNGRVVYWFEPGDNGEDGRLAMICPASDVVSIIEITSSTTAYGMLVQLPNGKRGERRATLKDLIKQAKASIKEHEEACNERR